MSDIFKSRTAFKPLSYEWAFFSYELQNKMHWIPEEVPLQEDIRDWNHTLSDSERNLLTQIFRFFTQMDVDVADVYVNKYLQWFKCPEVRMMLTAIANMESTHIHAYSLLLDTIGMPETEYKAFLDYEAMNDKHEYFFNEENKRIKLNKTEVTQDILLDIAKFSAFGEGMQLFSSFVILLNFSRFGKMKGMGQIVTWGIRDESLHVESMNKVFHQIIKENPKVWTKDLKKKIYDTCRDMVDLEDKFIDLAFEMGNIEGLDKDEVKQYIRHIADRRLLQLGLKPNYGDKSPLDWLDWILNGAEHTNFFENRSTEYSKGALNGSWDECWGD